MEALTRPATPEVEIGHVLFVGCCGIAEQPDEQKALQLQELDRTLLMSEEFQELLVEGKVLKLPLPTGVAVVAKEDSESCLFRIALDTWKAGLDQAKLPIALSIHSGPVFRQFDISMKETVAGAGVNIAKRLCDHANANELLVSAEFSKRLDEHWLRQLTPRDPVEIREGTFLDLFSMSEASPRGLPKPVSRQSTSFSPPQLRVVESPSRKVVLFYKRRCSPDEYLVNMLEVRLTELGHSVFVDRHLTGGVNWGKEIRRKIEEADFVVPLISMSAAQSEMVLGEIVAAAESQKTKRRPQIVPLRIAYEGDLPTEIGQYLNHIQYCLWEEMADDQRVIAELQNVFAKDPKVTQNIIEVKPSQLPSMSFEAVGGAVPLDSPFYIERKSDKLFKDAILARESTVLAKGARQMGKTSLLARGIQEARQLGWRVAVTDFQKIEPADFESSDRLFRALAESIYDGLGANLAPNDSWKETYGPNKNLERYLSAVIKEEDSHFVWALDEVDRLLVVPYGSEVFGLFRSWHNDRALNPHGPFGKLTQVFAYATEAHLFIRDLNQSPFNIGKHLTLEDFTLDESRRLNELYQSPIKAEDELFHLHEIVGGHPFLLRKALYTMQVYSLSLGEFSSLAVNDDGPVADHLKRIVFLLSKDPELAEELKLVLQDKPTTTESSFFRLRSAGVITGSSPSEPRMRCNLYRMFLRRHLLGSRA